MLPKALQGKAGGGMGSASTAAACAAAASSAEARADTGARPRTERSRFVTTRSCSAGVSAPQFVGKTIGPRPSADRALSKAVTTSQTQVIESLYVVLPHTPRKFGDGGMFEVGGASAMAGVKGWSGDGAEGRVAMGIVVVGALGTAAGASVTGGSTATGSVEVVADGSVGGEVGMVIGAGGIVIGADGAVVDDEGMGRLCRRSPSALCFDSTVFVTSHVTMSALARTTTNRYHDTLLRLTV